MSREWKVEIVKELFKVETGSTPSTKQKKYWLNGKINWITPKDLSLLKGKIYLEKSERQITEDGFKAASLKLLAPRSIIISTRAPVGYVAIIEEHATFNQGCKGLSPKDGKLIYPEFYAYFLLNKKKTINNLSGGSTFKELSKTILENFQVLLPPLSEQKKIADVLSTVDQAIEKVDEAIEKTQRLKKGLMQQLLTRGIGHKKFRETEIGRIPEEWDVNCLGDLAALDRGKFAHRPRNDPRFYGGKHPFIQTGDISEAKGIVKKYSQTLNEEGIKISRLFKKGTLVITIAGNIGDIGILNFDSYFPDSIVGIIPVKTKINSFFLLYMMTKLKSEISSIAPRSTQKNINLEILRKIKLPLPPLFEQIKIADILSVSDKKIELLTNRKTKLERVKKGLMSDLLTGRKRVKLDH